MSARAMAIRDVSGRNGTASLARALSVALLAMAPLAAQDPFAQHIRPTDPLAPEEERRSFHLPPGFEIELVAAEPEIQKPMNMAFDARGRLWITDTREYPFPVPPGERGRDTIKILEDTDGDARADRIITFADGLNIPIGIYPYRGGAVAFSIPNIYHFHDDDGDGRADRREILYGPLGYERDTHGLNNAFRRTFDGWLYVCHGFSNTSTVRGRDGSAITMQSGNTYRIRLDGSRVEQFTWGQVNPFGMTCDPLGNFFTADCHSSPIYQLLREGQYPGFGRPDDGLGFVPPMMKHGHGSTAIAGIAFYAAENFPEEYRGNIFVGNVWTSRVNRDSLAHHGSTVLAKEEPDFVRTDDPWFRPVDLQVGPDGALYVADFYNRIIGHYEVPLDHPGRDRTSGRIWRIVYRGDGDGSRRAQAPPDLSRAAAAELVATLEHPNLTLRNLATTELVDRVGAAAVEALGEAMRDPQRRPALRGHGLWALQRLGALTPALLRRAARDRWRLVRAHAMRVLSETRPWTGEHRRLAVAGLGDADGFVSRAAADALGQHPHPENVAPLLALHHRVPAADNHRRHTVRMALRNQFREPGALARFETTRPDREDARVVASVALGLPTADAGSYLLRYLEKNAESREVVTRYLRHAARHVPAAEIPAAAAFTRRNFAGDVDFQVGLLVSIRAGLEQRGADPGPLLIDWAAELAGRLLDSVEDESGSWSGHAVPGLQGSANPWVLQKRPSADGDRDALFLSSLPRGETLTGILRSPPFEIPPALSFYIAGHVGPPGRPVVARNFVRLREAATGAILGQVRPPRDDTARQVRWDLAAHAGKEGYLEVVDGDRRRAYAWLAVGRLEPPVVALPEVPPARASERRQAAADLVARFGLRQFRSRLEPILSSTSEEPACRAAAARALLALEPDATLSALEPLIAESDIDDELRERISAQILERDPGAAGELLTEAVRTTPGRLQVRVAEALAGSARGAATLLDLVEKGHAAARLLTRPAVREKILAAGPENAAARLEELTADLPPEGATLPQRLGAGLRQIVRAGGRAEEGARLFSEHCAACHQVDGEGSVIGPQLDGIGLRGVERILEDIVDPNRNVDAAFRITTYILADGTVIAGLHRRDEGETVVVADTEGKEVVIPRSRIIRRLPSQRSLMPDNFFDVIPVPDFQHLLAFLLSKRTRAEEEPQPDAPETPSEESENR